MLGCLVPDRTQHLVHAEREWLRKLKRSLAAFEPDATAVATLTRPIAQLDRLFLLVVVGEFNAGKSAFVNALVGARVLDEGPTPTTTRLQILRYGDVPGRQVAHESLDVISAPVALLRDIDIVDTPGTNAIFREHERLTNEFVPQADLVLFVTSADRPFTESERVFLENIRDWGKKVVVIVNKVDLLEREADREQVRRFVTEHAQVLLGSKPEVFLVSARSTLREKLGEAPGAADGGGSNGFGALEYYIASTLDQQERLRLKLLNPIGIGLRLAARARDTIRERLELLRQDLRTIGDIERQVDVYRTDLSREFDFRLADVDNVLYQFENRGVAFFDETLRLGRVPDLLNKPRLQREFERQVVADVPQQIEQHVHDVIDWMVASEFRQWQAVNEHVATRRAAYDGRIVGGTDAKGFQYDRARLINTVWHAAYNVVQTYDQEREASAMAESVRAAVAGAALAQAGAVSVGTLVTLLASTTAADVTGIIAAGSIAVLGLFIIPSKRTRAKADLRRRIADLRESLMRDLRTQFEREVERSAHEVMEAVGPYTQFVRAEFEKLTALDQELAEIADALGRIRGEVDRLAA